MLVNERGPFDLLLGLRELSGIKHDENGQPASWSDKNPLICMLCTSVWVGIALYLLPRWVSDVMAISGAAVVIEKKTGFEFPFKLPRA